MARTFRQWGPLRQLENFQRDFDELFDRLLRAKWRSAANAQPLPPVESYIEEDQLVIRADLPGVDPEDIQITITGNVLRVAGRREPSKEPQVGIRREFRHGPFERTLTLPQGVAPEQIKASYRNGVLELRVPLPQKPAAHKVRVRTEKE
jgi:HSP20 family protein